MTGVWQAVIGSAQDDRDKGYKFSTCTTWWIRHSISRDYLT
jgi:DNA-directed RNA polymerase sigma subunit (sigma70/sigma32)